MNPAIDHIYLAHSDFKTLTRVTNGWNIDLREQKTKRAPRCKEGSGTAQHIKT